MIAFEVRILRVLLPLPADGRTLSGPPLAVEWTDGRTRYVTPPSPPPGRWIPWGEA